MPMFTHAPVSQCTSCSTDLKGKALCESPRWPGYRCEECCEQYFIERNIPREFICCDCNDTFESIRGHRFCFSCRSKAADTFFDAHSVAGEAARVLLWQLIHAARVPELMDWLEARLRRLRLFVVQSRRRIRNDQSLRTFLCALTIPPAVFAFLYMPL